MPSPDLRLIVITDEQLAAPRDWFDVVREALEAGAPAIQLRNKTAAPRRLLEDARRLRRLTSQFGALLFINDRLDIALAAGADGVHLGPHDLPIRAARAIVPRNFLIGISTDQPSNAADAELGGADYIGCGAVFGTTSKAEVAGEAIGAERVTAVAQAVSIPVVGIGGITPSNVSGVAEAGAAGAAVIGAVMKAENVGEAVRSLLNPFAR